MASLIMQRVAFPAPRAFTSMARSALSAQRSHVLPISGISSLRRSFSQTFQLREKRYTESHEWISFNPDGKTCKIGVSEYAAEALGDVVYVELPEKGGEVEQGEHFGSVESVKSASEIMSPVTGTVIAVNDGLVETPADLGKDPEGEGWLVEVETADGETIEGLMSADAYEQFRKEEE